MKWNFSHNIQLINFFSFNYILINLLLFFNQQNMPNTDINPKTHVLHTKHHQNIKKPNLTLHLLKHPHKNNTILKINTINQKKNAFHL